MIMDRRRAIIGISKTSSRLPAEYQEVEYLQSGDRQLIRYICDITPSLKVTFTYMPLAFSNASMVFGIYDANVTPSTWGLVNNANLQSYSGSSSSSTATLNEKQTVTFTTGRNYPGSSYKMPLFGRYRGYNDQYANIRIYYVEIENSSGVIRQLVPCYRKSDNKPFLYDLVNDTRYSNSATSGQDFILGPDVN